MIKLYTDTKHYQLSSRKELIDVLRPFIKEKKVNQQAAAKEADSLLSEFTLVDTLGACDVAVLPMSWNYYYEKKKTKAAWEFVEMAARANKKVISWTSGDFGITPPYHESVYVFRPSGYDNKYPRHHRPSPIFITDPIKVYFDRDEEKVIHFPANGNAIGFCGLANPSFAKHFKEWITIGFRNIKYYFKVAPLDPQEMISSTGLRCKVLDKLEGNKQLKINFIRRNQYRGGAVTHEERAASEMAYFTNILHSDLVLCVRGNGNFSVRFYECLSMGRIPLLINTHSPLPDISPLKWSDYLIMVEKDEIDKVPEKIAAFLQGKDLMQQRAANRALFIEYLTNTRFWKRNITEIYNNNK